MYRLEETKNGLNVDPTCRCEEVARQYNAARAHSVASAQGASDGGTHFRRQAPIGPYVVDFFCPAEQLIVELDGGHHNNDDEARRDRIRQDWLEKEGYRVIRFWNSEISDDLNAVLERIHVELYGARDAEAAPMRHHRKRN